MVIVNRASDAATMPASSNHVLPHLTNRGCLICRLESLLTTNRMLIALDGALMVSHPRDDFHQSSIPLNS